MAESSMNPPVALTIAGSDSGGGAGIEADLKTFSALGVFGTVAITAVTAQNTAVVAGVAPMDPEFVRLQVETVVSDFPVAAVKTGMLANSSIVRTVGTMARDGLLPHLVVDPVLVSSSGGRLLDEDAIPVYVETLLPFAEVVTPNLREAKLLSGIEINDVDEMIEAGRRIASYGPAIVVVKGGHLEGANSPDVIVSGDDVRVLEAIWIPTKNDHGTGCSLSSAIAAYMARGETVTVSIERAKEFVGRAIAGAVNWSLGSGHGPLDHFGWNLLD
ncbi:MAG: bifunctional hydroxymethylpyrimidine kinase/phosphomethylpyrimidine kinase [Acidimicrobiales bacterium]